MDIKYTTLQEMNCLNRIERIFRGYKNVEVKTYNTARELYKKLGVSYKADKLSNELGLFFEYELLEPTYYSDGRVKKQPIKIKRIKSDYEINRALNHVDTSEDKRRRARQLATIPLDYIDRAGVYLIASKGFKEMYIGYTRRSFKRRLAEHYYQYYADRGNDGSRLAVECKSAKMYYLCLFDKKNLPTEQEAEIIEQQFINLLKYGCKGNMVNVHIKKDMSMPYVDDINIDLLCRLGIMQKVEL